MNMAADRGRSNLLHYITEVSFVLDDVGLYLDSHPHDKAAMAYYDKYKRERMDAVREYENMYGPISHYSVNGPEWIWVDEPWPWEGV